MKRAVRAIVLLVASALLIFGIMLLGLEYYRHRLQNVPLGLWRCIAGAILIAGAIVLMAVSRAVAEQLTDDFEE